MVKGFRGLGLRNQGETRHAGDVTQLALPAAWLSVRLAICWPPVFQRGEGGLFPPGGAKATARCQPCRGGERLAAWRFTRGKPEVVHDSL